MGNGKKYEGLSLVLLGTLINTCNVYANRFFEAWLKIMQLPTTGIFRKLSCGHFLP